jgi:hypothetical protein
MTSTITVEKNEFGLAEMFNCPLELVEILVKHYGYNLKDIIKHVEERYKGRFLNVKEFADFLLFEMAIFEGEFASVKKEFFDYEKYIESLLSAYEIVEGFAYVYIFIK